MTDGALGWHTTTSRRRRAKGRRSPAFALSLGFAAPDHTIQEDR
ncbi:MAG: hypothetical protein QOJ97_106 [Solirubrobacteraceae bacterium]|jgi:hypothetical protein|nr:hypothetical protein [Solirubrobacteraceae bacterium]